MAFDPKIIAKMLHNFACNEVHRAGILGDSCKKTYATWVHEVNQFGNCAEKPLPIYKFCTKAEFLEWLEENL